MTKLSLIRSFLVALFSLCFAGAVEAASLPTGVSYLVEGVGASTPGNIDLQSLPANSGSGSYNAHYVTTGATIDLHMADIVTGNSKNSDPYRFDKPGGINDNDNYLAVFSSATHYDPGSATFSLTSAMPEFDFIWGSINATNFITVTSNAGTYSIYGSEILANIPGPNNENVSRYFRLFDASGIKSVVFNSNGQTFEAARISAVPLPAAALLFGSALAGTAMLRRRKQA